MNIFEPFTHPKTATRVNATVPKQESAKSMAILSSSSINLVDPTLVPSTSQPVAAASSNPYCTVCKKKFSNQSTYQEHLQSDKHKKQMKSGASATKGHPVVQDATKDIKKAKAIMDKNPAVAADVLWEIAQDIASLDKQKETARDTLLSALTCMKAMDVNPSLRKSTNSQISVSWSARSLLKTTFECQLALARLDLYVDRAEDAVDRYVFSLCDFLGIRTEILRDCKSDQPRTIAARMMNVAEAIPRKLAKEEDQNQALEAILEVGIVMLSVNNKLYKDGILLQFLAYSLALDKNRMDRAFAILQDIITTYDSLDRKHFGCECAILVIENHLDRAESSDIVIWAVIESLKGRDYVRADNTMIYYQEKQQNCEWWAKYLAKLVNKRRCIFDPRWLAYEAMPEWRQLKKDTGQSCSAIEDGLPAILEGYMLPELP